MVELKPVRGHRLVSRSLGVARIQSGASSRKLAVALLPRFSRWAKDQLLWWALKSPPIIVGPDLGAKEVVNCDSTGLDIVVMGSFANGAVMQVVF